MTIFEALSRFDEMKPNAFSEGLKLHWLSDLDLKINKAHGLYTDCDYYEDFTGYDADTDMSTELLAKNGYEDLYCAYMSWQTDMLNEEYSRYNNTRTLFEDMMTDYMRYLNRNYTHKTTEVRYW